MLSKKNLDSPGWTVGTLKGLHREHVIAGKNGGDLSKRWPTV
jgi:hypothetical protein